MVEQPTFNRLGLGSNPWTLIYSPGRKTHIPGRPGFVLENLFSQRVLRL